MRLLSLAIIVLILFFGCQSKENPKNRDVVGDVSFISLKEENYVSKEDSILSDIKDVLLNEAKNWSVDFYVDTLDIITEKTLFSEQQGYKIGKYYLIKDRNSKEWNVSIASYEFKNSDFTQQILEKHRLAYYDESMYDSEFMMGGMFFKIPYIAFNIDSTFYEIMSPSSPIGHIVAKTIDKIRIKYSLSKDFEIPCE